MIAGDPDAGSKNRRSLLFQSSRKSETPTSWKRIQKSRRSYATRNRQFDPEITLWRLNFRLVKRMLRPSRASRGTFAPLRLCENKS